MNHEMTYKRPENLADAIIAFDEAEGKVGVLCGGAFDRSGLLDADLLIDIQNLRPSEMLEEGNSSFGPAETLSDLQQAMKQFVDFDQAAVAEAGLNVRNSLSLYNFLKVADGRSPLLVAMRAMSVVLRWQPGDQLVCLEEYLGTRHQDKPGFWSELIIEEPGAFVFGSVARTPLDKPIVALAMTRDINGTLRVALGGSVDLPVSYNLLENTDGGRDWVRHAFGNLNDGWASCEYRQDVGGVLFDRLIERLTNETERGAL